jgi:hypothetical protein
VGACQPPAATTWRWRSESAGKHRGVASCVSCGVHFGGELRAAAPRPS